MPRKNGSGIKRIINAFKYSFEGFMAAAKSEEAFRQELFLFIVLIPVTFLFDVTCIEQILMVASIFFVITMELVNSAIETIIDRISEEKHPLSKKAKDVGSAVVFFAFANLIFTWACILL